MYVATDFGSSDGGRRGRIRSSHPESLSEREFYAWNFTPKPSIRNISYTKLYT